jgi:anti-anti-sigma factor
VASEHTVCDREQVTGVLYEKVDEGQFVRFVLTGRFTGQDGDCVRELIGTIKAGAGRRLVVDLQGVDFIDSAGIGMLLVLNGEATASGSQLAIVVDSGQVHKIVSLTRIALIIPQFESLDAYIAGNVPERVLHAGSCAPDEDPLALAVRTLHTTATSGATSGATSEDPGAPGGDRPTGPA